jgi:hypothetical protein
VITSERLTGGVADSGSAKASAEQRERNESALEKKGGKENTRNSD